MQRVVVVRHRPIGDVLSICRCIGSWTHGQLEAWAQVARCLGNEVAGSGRTVAALVGQHIPSCVAPKVATPSPRRNLLVSACEVWMRKGCGSADQARCLICACMGRLCTVWAGSRGLRRWGLAHPRGCREGSLGCKWPDSWEHSLSCVTGCRPHRAEAMWGPRL